MAFLVDFNPRTRVVAEVPDGMTAEEFIESDNGFNILVKAARENMVADLNNYLMGENAYAEEDEECPFGTFDWDK